MKRWIILGVILFLIMLSSGCGLSDLTDNANALLTEAEELLREIDKQVETGKLLQDVGDKAKDVVNSAIETLSAELQQNVGYIFNNVNQTLDNTFYNLGNLLVTLKTEILGGTALEIMEQTFSQIRLTVSQVSAETQDIILLVSGQIFIFLDKTTNAIIIILCIVLLAIGLIIFVIIFLAKKGNLTAGAVIALVLTGIYVIFFLTVVIITPVRVWMISGFDIGSRVTPQVLTPKISAIQPVKFIAGIDDRIYIYGRHLNLIKKLAVKLQQGSTVKKVFPDDAVIVKTYGQILLGNLDKLSTGFQYLDFSSFKTEVIDKDATLKASSLVNSILSARVEEAFNLNREQFMKPLDITIFKPIALDTVKSLSVPEFKVQQQVYSVLKSGTTVISIADSPISKLLFDKANLFYDKFWNITAGLYGLNVYDDTQAIPDAAALEIKFPDPPAPKPDIKIVALTYAGDALVGKSITPRIVLGFTDHKEIKKDFFVRLKSLTQTTYNTEFMVKKADIASIPANGLLTLSLNAYPVSTAGNHQFEIFADSKNDIVEANEANNTGTFGITAQKYRYDFSATIQVFNPKKSYDTFEDEYRVKVRMYLNNSSEASKNVNHDGEPGDSWAVNWTVNYDNVSPGDKVYVYTSGHESDSPDADDDMGQDSTTIDIKDTGAGDTINAPIILDTGGYELRGTYSITRSITP